MVVILVIHSEHFCSALSRYLLRQSQPSSGKASTVLGCDVVRKEIYTEFFVLLFPSDCIHLQHWKWEHIYHIYLWIKINKYNLIDRFNNENSTHVQNKGNKIWKDHNTNYCVSVSVLLPVFRIPLHSNVCWPSSVMPKVLGIVQMVSSHLHVKLEDFQRLNNSAIMPTLTSLELFWWTQAMSCTIYYLQRNLPSTPSVLVPMTS